jgi:DNA-binding MarR family transcriptional regulator
MSATVDQGAPKSHSDEAWELLRTLFARQRRRFLLAASELELHPAQAGTLLHLDPGVPRPMHELATLLACDNSNVTGIIDRLESRGLVERQPYDQDRRVKHVLLTEGGEATRERLLAQVAQPPDGLERLSPEEQQSLRDLLSRVVDED